MKKTMCLSNTKVYISFIKQASKFLDKKDLFIYPSKGSFLAYVLNSLNVLPLSFKGNA